MRIRQESGIPSIISIPYGCWIWTRSMNEDGYGYLNDSGKIRKAHRVFYEEFNGPIPPGLEIDHICRLRCCVNPAHLRTITHIENVKQLVTRQREFCKYGHALNGSNLLPRIGTWINSTAGRRCRECMRLACRKHRLKKKAARG